MRTSHKSTILLIGTISSELVGLLAVCEQLKMFLERRGWRVYITSGKRSRFLRMVDIFMTTISHREEYQIALIEVYGGLSFIWAQAAAILLQILRKPYVLALYGGALPDFSRRWSWLMRHFLNSANAVIAPSRYLQEAMTPYCENIMLLRYGVDLSEFTYRLRENPQPRLVTLRAVHEVYNPPMAVKVLANILPHFPEASLVMIGPNKGDGSWEKTIELSVQLGVNHRVQMLGMIPRSEVGIRLNDGDIFLNTPNIDNTPLSIAEAMACGLCIVSTDAGGLPYILTPDIDSMMVHCDDHEAMAEAVIRILIEPGLARGLSESARREAEQYDWPTIVAKWEQLFIDIMDP